MRFDQDDKERDRRPENDGEWTKEPAKHDPRFDFAAFLGPDSLEDRITDVLDGKDLLDEEAYGEFSPDYVPRRSGSGERGRHEAPGPEPEDEDEEDDEEPSPDGGDDPQEEMDFQEEPQRKPVFPDEPPPRPKVIVAEPAPRVYVDPRTEYGPVEAPPPSGGMGRGVKWLIAALISVAVVLAAAVLVFKFLPDIKGMLGLSGSASPAPTDVLGGIPEARPTQPPAAPTNTPELKAPEVRIYNITASAGAGGSVSPSGIVDVQEGGSVSFTFTPDEGYELSQLVVDGSSGFVQTGYTFSDVRQDHSIHVEFKQVELPPPVVEVTDEPTPEPTAEPAAEPTAEPPAPPVEAPPADAPAPDPGVGPAEPPPAGGEGGEGSMEPPEEVQ